MGQAGDELILGPADLPLLLEFQIDFETELPHLAAGHEPVNEHRRSGDGEHEKELDVFGGAAGAGCVCVDLGLDPGLLGLERLDQVDVGLLGAGHQEGLGAGEVTRLEIVDGTVHPGQEMGQGGGRRTAPGGTEKLGQPVSGISGFVHGGR